MTTNRIVALGSALISLALGILPVIGNFDWQSTAGCIGGIIAVLGITQKWLTGWQAHEARSAVPRAANQNPVGNPVVVTAEPKRKVSRSVRGK